MKYYPYLRGKQYELLALREIMNVDAQGDVICPLLEPVKLSVSLKKTIETLRDTNRQFALIVNPEYGELSGKPIAEVYRKINDFLGGEVSGMSLALLYHVRTSEIQDFVDQKAQQNIFLIVKKEPENGTALSELGQRQNITSVFIDENLSRSARRMVHVFRCDKITLSNRFTVKPKNADYLDEEDEFFSDDHLFYAEEGFQGFSDYATIGDEYKETGFLPYAVAVHMTYKKTEDNTIWVHHFVSDSNEDYNDVPNKLYEALDKMAHWYQEKGYPHTRAFSQFMDYYRNESFPGLGMLKKLSVLNHFEIISTYFDNELQ